MDSKCLGVFFFLHQTRDQERRRWLETCQNCAVKAICKLTFILLQMLEEYVTCLCRRQLTLFLSAVVVARISLFSCTSSQRANSHRATQRGSGDTCTYNKHYRRRTLILGNLNLLYWTVSMPALCSEGRHYLHLLRLFTAQTFWK